MSCYEGGDCTYSSDHPLIRSCILGYLEAVKRGPVFFMNTLETKN